MAVIYNINKIYKLAFFLAVNFLLITLSYKYPSETVYNRRFDNSFIKEFEFENKININLASIDDLRKIKGVGHKKAKLILSYRKKHGNFKKIDDLKKVPGINHSIYKNIKDYIII